MSVLRTIKEFINPDSVSYPSISPFEAGLRPNALLDEGRPILGNDAGHEPDDVAFFEDGTLVFSSGTSLFTVSGGDVRTLAGFDGRTGAIEVIFGEAVTAVEGLGIVGVRLDGTVRTVNDDPLVQRGVTDLALLPDGDILVTIGSSADSPWSLALARKEATGRIVRVSGDRTSVEASGLPWPSGIAVAGSEVLLSLSFAHRIERRPLEVLGAAGSGVVGNLPVYPGRITSAGGHWWVAAPFARNRMTELLLDEPEFLEEMVATIDPDQWFVPRLRNDNHFTSVAQYGAVRVHGVIKPWAPPRSYGLFFEIDRFGRVSRSAHSRADGDRHGITGIAVSGDTVVAAAQGYRDLLAVTMEGAQG
ncbi:hypothetical protein [Microbacterium sp. No. 7]|uniref:hypothetical protein n=1 Tax=Microbacterium sp. No. 7 TaxID=1714373 RepID=UPI0006D2C87F|nr:hypothetical protein [Microbacterium sp. No. 7]